jgi:hypothetical protein
MWTITLHREPTQVVQIWLKQWVEKQESNQNGQERLTKMKLHLKMMLVAVFFERTKVINYNLLLFKSLRMFTV